MISIVVCTYNRDMFIRTALEKIAACGFPPREYEILLVDNNSSDNNDSYDSSDDSFDSGSDDD